MAIFFEKIQSAIEVGQEVAELWTGSIVAIAVTQEVSYHQVEVFRFLDAGSGVPRVTPLALLLKSAIARTARALQWLLLRSHDSGAHTGGGHGARHEGQRIDIYRRAGLLRRGETGVAEGSNRQQNGP